MADRMEIQVSPPDVALMAKALRSIVSTGLPIDSEYDDGTLLGLRGVVARSVDQDSRLSRVKALEDLLRRLLAAYPDDELGEAARILFGLTLGVRGKNLTNRRQTAARQAGYEADHFRKHIEPKIIRQLAWQLHRDSQNYIPRTKANPPPLESSGDTPVIREGDVSSRDVAEYEELLSRLWADVYLLRAEILRVERLKSWPYDQTEPKLSEQKLEEALAARDKTLQGTKITIQRYLDTYGKRIAHGDAEYGVAGLLRLAGWVEESPQKTR
jgi:hypothetical protein